MSDHVLNPFFPKLKLKLILLEFAGLLLFAMTLLIMVANPSIFKDELFFVSAILFLVIASLPLAGMDYFSPPVVTAAALWLFHQGWNFIIHLFPSVSNFFPWAKTWSSADSWVTASIFSSLCIIFYLIGCFFSLLLFKRAKPLFVEKNKWFVFVGQAIFYGSSIGIAVLVARDGLFIFNTGYAEGFNVFLRRISPFLPLICLTLPIVKAKKGVGELSVITVVFLLTGLLALQGIRSIAMFFFVTFLVISVGSGERIRLWKVLALFLAIMLCLSSIREIRHSFGNGFKSIVKSFSSVFKEGMILVPAAFGEFGLTLETVSRAVDISEKKTPLFGKSYLDSVKFILFDKWLGVEKSIDTFEFFVTERFPGGGGSIIGEAYYNFKWAGAIIIFFPLGFVVTSISLGHFKVGLIFISCLTYSILAWVRGYFQSVTTFSFYFFIAFLMLVCLKKVLTLFTPKLV